tara:strand:+ start:105 stop:647 length:543 start_codon:yes stop_codon:yes gene_type:complete
MTPRLRNLLIGLGISVVIMIVDQVNQSSGSGSSKKPQKTKTQRTKKVIAESSVQKTSTPITASVASTPTTRRRSSRSSQLVGWQRNPFNSVALSSEADVESGSINSEKQQDIEKSILIKNLERYNVEIVAEFNNEKVVLIDNRRFRQGEYLNNDILIERIENDQITFKNGNTSVTRIVGN